MSKQVTNRRVELFGIFFIILIYSVPGYGAIIDCKGKAFHCANSTHFMICVDVGNGISNAIEDMVVPCPPGTECLNTNIFECEIAITTTPPASDVPEPKSFITTTTEVTDHHLKVVDINAHSPSRAHEVIPVKPTKPTETETPTVHGIGPTPTKDINKNVDVIATHMPHSEISIKSGLMISTEATTSTTEAYKPNSEILDGQLPNNDTVNDNVTQEPSLSISGSKHIDNNMETGNTVISGEHWTTPSTTASIGAQRLLERDVPQEISTGSSIVVESSSKPNNKSDTIVAVQNGKQNNETVPITQDNKQPTLNDIKQVKHSSGSLIDTHLSISTDVSNNTEYKSQFVEEVKPSQIIGMAENKNVGTATIFSNIEEPVVIEHKPATTEIPPIESSTVLETNATTSSQSLELLTSHSITNFSQNAVSVSVPFSNNTEQLFINKALLNSTVNKSNIPYVEIRDNPTQSHTNKSLVDTNNLNSSSSIQSGMLNNAISNEKPLTAETTATSIITPTSIDDKGMIIPAVHTMSSKGDNEGQTALDVKSEQQANLEFNITTAVSNSNETASIDNENKILILTKDNNLNTDRGEAITNDDIATLQNVTFSDIKEGIKSNTNVGSTNIHLKMQESIGTTEHGTTVNATSPTEVVNQQDMIITPPLENTTQTKDVISTNPRSYQNDYTVSNPVATNMEITHILNNNNLINVSESQTVTNNPVDSKTAINNSSPLVLDGVGNVKNDDKIRKDGLSFPINKENNLKHNPIEAQPETTSVNSILPNIVTTTTMTPNVKTVVQTSQIKPATVDLSVTIMRENSTDNKTQLLYGNQITPEPNTTMNNLININEGHIITGSQSDQNSANHVHNNSALNTSVEMERNQVQVNLTESNINVETIQIAVTDKNNLSKIKITENDSSILIQKDSTFDGSHNKNERVGLISTSTIVSNNNEKIEPQKVIENNISQSIHNTSVYNISQISTAQNNDLNTNLSMSLHTPKLMSFDSTYTLNTDAKINKIPQGRDEQANVLVTSETLIDTTNSNNSNADGKNIQNVTNKENETSTNNPNNNYGEPNKIFDQNMHAQPISSANGGLIEHNEQKKTDKWENIVNTSNVLPQNKIKESVVTGIPKQNYEFTDTPRTVIQNENMLITNERESADTHLTIVEKAGLNVESNAQIAPTTSSKTIYAQVERPISDVNDGQMPHNEQTNSDNVSPGVTTTTKSGGQDVPTNNSNAHRQLDINNYAVDSTKFTKSGNSANFQNNEINNTSNNIPHNNIKEAVVASGVPKQNTMTQTTNRVNITSLQSNETGKTSNFAPHNINETVVTGVPKQNIETNGTPNTVIKNGNMLFKNETENVDADLPIAEEVGLNVENKYSSNVLVAPIVSSKRNDFFRSESNSGFDDMDKNGGGHSKRGNNNIQEITNTQGSNANNVTETGTFATLNTVPNSNVATTDTNLDGMKAAPKNGIDIRNIDGHQTSSKSEHVGEIVAPTVTTNNETGLMHDAIPIQHLPTNRSPQAGSEAQISSNVDSPLQTERNSRVTQDTPSIVVTNVVSGVFVNINGSVTKAEDKISQKNNTNKSKNDTNQITNMATNNETNEVKSVLQNENAGKDVKNNSVTELSGSHTDSVFDNNNHQAEYKTIPNTTSNASKTTNKNEDIAQNRNTNKVVKNTTPSLHVISEIKPGAESSTPNVIYAGENQQVSYKNNDHMAIHNTSKYINSPQNRNVVRVVNNTTQLPHVINKIKFDPEVTTLKPDSIYTGNNQQKIYNSNGHVALNSEIKSSPDRNIKLVNSVTPESHIILQTKKQTESSILNTTLINIDQKEKTNANMTASNKKYDENENKVLAQDRNTGQVIINVTPVSHVRSKYRPDAASATLNTQSVLSEVVQHYESENNTHEIIRNLTLPVHHNTTQGNYKSGAETINSDLITSPKQQNKNEHSRNLTKSKTNVDIVNNMQHKQHTATIHASNNITIMEKNAVNTNAFNSGDILNGNKENKSTSSGKVIYKTQTEAHNMSSNKNNVMPSKHSNMNKDGPIKTPESTINCETLHPGRYADRNDCRKFYICIHRSRQPLVRHCPENTVFSEFINQCTKNLSHCIRNNQFLCTSEGRFSDILKDDVYYICARNSRAFVRYKLMCQNDFYLNKSDMKCTKKDVKHIQYSSESTTNDDTSKASDNNSNTLSGDEDDNKFRCLEAGKFTKPDHCRKYYECVKTKKGLVKKTRKCDGVFHKEKRKCVDDDSYEC